MIAQTGLARDGNHRYFLDGKGPIPSVTTIIKAVADKQDGLIAGARKQTAAYALKNPEFLAKSIVDFGLDATIANVSQVCAREWKAKGDRGTAVHALVEAELRHRYSKTPTPKPFIAPEFQPDMDALDAFLRRYSPRILGAETLVVNLTENYAGTVDLWAEIDGETWCIDVKTGKWLSESFSLQLVAYARAERIGVPGDPKSYHVPKATRFGVLHLRPADLDNEGEPLYPEGFALVPYRCADEDWQGFLAASRVNRWLAGSKKVVGQPITNGHGVMFSERPAA